MNLSPHSGRRSFCGRSMLVLCTLLVLALPLTANAAVEGGKGNFDALHASASSSAKPSATPPSSTSSTGGRAHLDASLGVPSFVWLDRSGSGGTKGLSVRGLGSARAVLAEIAPRYGLNRTDVASALLQESRGSDGSRISTFTSEIDGIEVWRDEMSILFDSMGQAVAVSGSLASSSLRVEGSAQFVLSPGAAAAVAATDATGLPVEASAFHDTRHKKGAYGYFGFSAGLPLSEEIRIKPVFYRMPDRLIPAYYLELWVVNDERSSHLWGYVISAEDGSMLNRTSLTSSEAFSYRVWADTAAPNIPFTGPTADFMPHPTGTNDGSFPAYVAPNLITLQNVPFSQNDPWLPAGAVATNGNNVDAYADITGGDGFDASDLRAGTTAPGEFDRTYDTAAEPGSSADQRMASITQLFYTINFLHDWFYDSGFDEASGNAQMDNYSRGGIGGDPIQGEAQDTDGIAMNNANMSTPADGTSPKMQMYFWDASETRSLITSATGASLLETGAAAFGPQNFNVTADIALADDVTGTTSDACEAIVNDLTGKIALVDRGSCTFTLKVLNAQTAGAIGVLVANNNATGAFSMTGVDATITIPSLMITQADGITIKSALGSAVTATMSGTTGPLLDGTIDNGLVAHEWGHYLSNRLLWIGSNQSQSMGEGWSDFVSLLMAVREGDDPDGVYSASQYMVQAIGSDPAYFGIRRYPYSTNMSVNPLTFKHIEDGVALPLGPPRNVGHPNNSEVHNSGEVWAQMLWECYAALLKDTPRLTFAEAQQRMKGYLIASMKMTPASPTFVEARDAVLAVAYAADPADHELFCAAFAKRGIGVGAVAPARFSGNHAGVVESFVCGGDLAFLDATLDDSVINCDADGLLDGGETGVLTMTFENIGTGSLSSSTVTVTSTNPDITFPTGSTQPIGASDPYGVASATISVALASSAAGFEEADFQFEFTDPGFANAGVRLDSVTFVANVDEQLNASATDNVEAFNTSWTQGGTPVPTGEWERFMESLTSHYWHADNPVPTSDSSLISPALQVLGSGDLVISFDHRYQFEADATTNWDGGVIEISTDGGSTWSDVGASASPGYGGTITDLATNPLALRSAFVGTSPSYPTWIPTVVNLGTAYAGQTVHFRFRLGADEASTAPGWDVDNISVAGISNTPFAVASPEAGCGELSIGNVMVLEGNSGSTNADLTVMRVGAPADTITVAWQTAANADAVSGSDFTAAAGALTFLPGESAKTVTVQVQGDASAEVDETFSVQLSSPSYATIVDGAGIVTIQNDDLAGVTVTPVSGLMTSEGGGSSSFTMVLSSQPSSDVTINLSSSDPAEGTVAPASAIFTSLNWNVAQMVTLTGVDDAVVDGDQPFTVITSNAVSADPGYAGMVITDVTATNIDDDSAGVVVTPVSGLMTTEGGGSASFTIVLSSQPSSDVTINLSSSDTAEGTVAPASAIFTSLNWNVAQMATLTGVDDALVDGDQPFTVITSNAVSADPGYAGMIIADVTATNIDDDSAGVVVTPVSGLMTSEGGGSASFTIVLSSQPSSDVTINLSSSNTAEGTVAPASTTFTSLNWNVAQTVTVTGVDDSLDDGDQSYTIVTSNTVSADLSYAAVDVSDVTATNVDDDSAVDDSDGDGVDDVIEDAGPNGGDGNGDGIADSIQPTVATLPAANGNGHLTVISTCELRDIRAVPAAELEPVQLLFPYALVEFRLPCASAEMTVLYHQGQSWNPGVGYWKYGPETPGQALTIKWYELPGATFDTTTVATSIVARVRFNLIDGQLGDDTGVDGVIVDQGGPGSPGAVASIPTASDFMLLGLMLLLATAGFLKLR